MIKKVLVVCALASAMLSGCSTLSTAQEAKGSGMSRIYNKDYNTVWSATDEVVRNSGLSVASSNKEKGENVAVFVSALDKSPQTKVEVVSKRVLATNVTAKDWDELLLRHLDGKLR